jgi:hypothetical protein
MRSRLTQSGKYPDAAFDVITPDKMPGFLLYQVKVSVTIIE